MSALAGTAQLLRLALRRDRIRLAVWTVATGGLTAYFAAALDTLYPTAAARQARADLIANPAGVILSGPGYGLENYNRGAMVANELVLSLLITVSVMSILLMSRHTRAEEESGRAELVRAAIVGRWAQLTAALLTALITNAAVGGLVAVGLIGSGLVVADSVAIGVLLAVTGMVLAAVTATTAQLSEHARTCSGLALAVLGLAFVLRAAGDVSGNALSWLSPLGWAQQTRAYVDLRVWPLLLSVAMGLVFVGSGYVLQSRRDVGAGLLAARLGRAEAAPTLASPFALALRQQRGALVGWSVALFLTGLACGSLSDSVDDLLASNAAARDLLLASGGSPVDAFLSAMLLFVALGVGAFAVMTMLRWRDEESGGRAEQVLATAVSRQRWAAGGVLVALAGSGLLLLAGGLGVGISAAIVIGDGGLVLSLAASSLAYLPAAGVLIGLTATLYGVRPAAASLAWVAVTYAVLVGMFGGLLGLPDWAGTLSPFNETPALPAGDADLLPLGVLAVLAVALIVLGLDRFARRDLAAT